MNIKKTSYQPILDILSNENIFSVEQIRKKLSLSRQLIQKYLKYMVDNNIVEKSGKAPRVYYSLKKLQHNKTSPLLYEKQQLLENNFLQFDVDGSVLSGVDGFNRRCGDRELDTNKQAEDFQKYIAYINSLRDKQGFIHDGYQKLTLQVKKMYLDDMLYFDVYQIGHFGKSKLANLAFYAKQSQSLELMKKVGEHTKNQLKSFIENEIFDAVCFVPHSLKRKHQIMDFLCKYRDIKLPIIELTKTYFSDFIIPQKSIKGIENRVKNAEKTIYYTGEKLDYKKILLIDDFVGSGATLNISAMKLKQTTNIKKIVGLALVGNIDMKYDVINEI